MAPSPRIKERLCLALDVVTADEALDWVSLTRDCIGVYKVGLQLFTAQGPGLIHRLRDAGAERIFLDLKLHDIPNTVAGAVRSAQGLADFMTLHAAGGEAMLRAAVEAAGEDIALLAVTVLTSLDQRDLHNDGYTHEGQDAAWLGSRRAMIAHEHAGVPGLVCSPLEVAQLRKRFPNVKLVVPGIRMPDGDHQDQARVGTPWDTIEAGADILVLGRMVLASPTPLAVLEALHRRQGDLG